MDQELKNKLHGLSPQQLKELMKKMGKEKKEFPLMPRNAEQVYPVTGAQKRMWFLSKLDPGSHLYTNPIGARLRAKSHLDIDLYVHGFRAIVRRHEIMRTSFLSRDGQILQQIHDEIPYTIEKTDLRALPLQEREAQLDRIVSDEGRKAIGIEELPLFRFRLILLGDQDFVLLYTSHHIISDAWSSTQIFREMQDIYEQNLSGNGGHQAPPKVQFVDYVHWENEWIGSPAYQQALAKWKSLVPAAPEPLRLPLDYLRPATIDYEGSLLKTTINAGLTEKLSDFSKKEGVNLFHTLLAVFNVLLHHYSRNEEISVGIPMANRKLREFQQTVGMFLNTLPHRSSINREQSFRSYLQQVKEISQDMVVHQDFPFEKLIEEVKPPRDLAISPLFQVLYVFQNIPDMYQWGDLEVTPVKQDTHVSKYELNLWVEEVAGSLYLSMTWQTRLFRKESIEQFLAYYEQMLNEAIRHPEQSIASLLPHTADQDTPVQAPAAGTYLAAFEEQVLLRPDAPALAHGTTTYSYRQLDETANRLAHCLLQQKKANDEIIALLLPRSAEQIVAILAIHKTGCAYLPLDPAITTERLEALLDNAGVQSVLAAPELLSRHAGVLGSKAIPYPSEKELQQYDCNSTGIRVQPHDLAYLLYTSGTTGNAKGVCIEHAQLHHYSEAIWKRMQLPAGSRLATVSGITTDLGNTQIFPALMHGACTDVVPESHITQPALLAAYMQEQAVDCLKIVPSHLASLLRSGDPGGILPRRLLILGGEKTTAALAQDIRRHRNDLRILNHYGPTETTIGVLTHEIGSVQHNEVIPLGTPLDNNRIFIMNAEGQRMPQGMPGEIVIGGANTGRGYHRNETQTQRSFFEKDGQRCYRTGDLGRVNSKGLIEFMGRIDRQLKIRGFRVEPEVIERTLLQSETVAQAHVLDRDGRSLAAFIVPAEGAVPDPDGLRRQLRNTLPAYMVPEEIIVLSSFPRLANGKIDTRALSEWKTADTGGSALIAPRTETELAIAHIWQELLRPEQLSITDNFFDAGGTSLIAIEFIDRLNRLFGTELGIGVLFESNSIQSLAGLVQNDNYTRDNSSLLLLRKGHTDACLFLAHPAGGDVLSYYELAGRIDSACNVYGLQSKDFSRADESIEALAARFLQAIRQQAPEGRWVFGGWSMGACVAYEMALQWQEQTGQTIPVVLLDQRAPVEDTAHDGPGTTALERQVAFAEKIEHLTGRRNNLKREVLEPLSSSERTVLFLQAFKESHLVPDDLRPEQFQGFLDKMMNHHDITASYRGRPYDGPVLLVKAQDSSLAGAASNARPCYGWSSLSAQLRTGSVPGNHVTIIRMPQAQAVAQLINQVLALNPQPLELPA